MPDVYEPFNADVETLGGYQYTDVSRKSSVHANRRFTRAIIENVNFENKTVVDVGCGDGTYTAILKEQTSAKSILGIDPAAHAIKRAQQNYESKFENLKFRNCYAKELITAGENFDVAIYRGVIHHVSDPAKEIAIAVKLAKEIFFLEPNGWNPIVKLLERVSTYHRQHKERSFRLKHYYKWIKLAGGSVERSFYFGLVPMFCPDCVMIVGAALEPWVEKFPGIRILCCGQVGIKVRSNISDQEQ